ncbi:MAG: PEP-utilizing enzyme [Akkermansia sp.]
MSCSGSSTTSAAQNLPEDEEETEKDQVLVAYDLTPSDTAAMDASLIHGFATEIGSSVSHTAILARPW